MGSAPWTPAGGSAPWTPARGLRPLDPAGGSARDSAPLRPLDPLDPRRGLRPLDPRQGALPPSAPWTPARKPGRNLHFLAHPWLEVWLRPCPLPKIAHPVNYIAHSKMGTKFIGNLDLSFCKTD